jgi:cell division protein YceG involved in septum cleavage
MTTMTLDTLFTGPSLSRTGTTAVRARVASPTMRLTRRGRLVVVVAALLVAFAIGVFVTAAGSVATLHPGTAEPTKIVQVGSGDTLWGIASQLADDGQVPAMMAEIKQLNALDSVDLQAGQRLVVPASR